ncbi:hypothetical protein PAMC26577_10685 [Caballeronia sordidicola]|uniref:Uncharacterized protein n=1 Tax=Caballeronia sordidicola TaxID=196367 RepID=A0A242MYM0_CABSO|nr:hypothetical protein PAMC26577_10685 [Caballeronia sordidicola]
MDRMTVEQTCATSNSAGKAVADAKFIVRWQKSGRLPRDFISH